MLCKQCYSQDLILGLAVLMLTGCSDMLADRDASLSKSFQVSEGGRLSLDADVGSIEVSSSDGTSLTIDVIRKIKTSNADKAEEILRKSRLDFRQEGRDVVVKAEHRQDDHWKSFWNGRSLEVRYVITVPRRYNIDLKTEGGSIRVSDLEGEVTVRTSGGSLQLGKILGAVNGKTSGGSISVEGCSGPLEVNTSGGSISLGKLTGSVHAHTSGGSIHIDEAMGDLNASTSGGSIQATLSKQPVSSSELNTSGGSIQLYLNPALNLNLTAKANGGRVETDVPVMVEGKIERSSLQGKMNAGGPELYVHTSGGNVHIAKMR